jgi:DNA recombination protein RmuC
MQASLSSPVVLSLLLVLSIAIALLVGWLIGRRRAHALEVELAAARAELASSEEIARERTQTLDLALERLRSGFDSVAGDALRSNSELFLQIAREMLGQQQQLALRNLTDREKSVEGMLAPVREALQKTHEQITRIEKERAESFGALRSSIEGVTLGQAALQRETRNLVTGAQAARGSRQVGRNDPASARRARWNGRALRLRRAGARRRGGALAATGHDRKHA